ncbi:hypothetical protein F1C16_21465 (plasmid) [Hymenobacter sp. NBH84]|uniref:hypothetical protein n=1 Tax=Hymenobacter sp. NBH84 TaxID=2596915 RepID=UPI001625C350|nr:hypothetical protein [Hymenobacter sp. NBH84]QNE42198.1 hypothetical protein F1C16_21465 [Hymenobacter sp. NBH84]
MHQLLPRLRAQDLLWREILADAGYANGFNYALLEQQGLTPWIPVFGHKPDVKGFTYDVKRDTYTCLAGKPLPFQKYDSCSKLRERGQEQLFVNILPERAIRQLLRVYSDPMPP